jgi:hypothetical protein
VGIFTQRDPIASILNRNGGYNAYGYVGQNPINGVDPSGHFSNDEIASSLGAGSFDEVIQIFRGDHRTPPFVGGRWGFLKLLQDAENGDALGWLSVPGWVPWRPKEFLEPKHAPKGQLYSSGCNILVEGMPLLPWVMDNFDPQDNFEIYHQLLRRPLLQAYYLDPQRRYYRDSGDKTSGLPDYASIIVNFDIYAPKGWGGIGVGSQVAYTVDRYGNAYLTSPFQPFEWPFVSFGVGAGVSPLSAGYTESYVVFPPSRDDSVIGEQVLKQLIPGFSSGVSVSLAIFQFGGEINWGDTDYVVATVGYVIGQLGVNLDLVVTTISLPKS